MGQQKGQVPRHIKPKQFNHPKPNHQLLIILEEAEDPRKPSCNFRYSLTTILFTTFVAVLCGAKDWEEIYQTSEGLMEWISSYVDVSNGIPSRKTMERVVSLIPTETLQNILKNFAHTLSETEKPPTEGDVVAIDGKTLRGSRGWDEKSRALHLLHAWSTDKDICLGQVSVDEKSNEITAIPQLIDALELKGTTITTDALNTQKGTATAIVNKKADYVLPVKANHKGLFEEIDLLFTEADSLGFCGLDAAQSESLEKSGGRIEARYYALLDAEDLPARHEWAACRSVGRVIRERTKNGKTSREVCYYITSLTLEIAKFARAVREHWGVENGLHWSLDVIFDEDNHRYQDRIGAANLSILRKMALAVLTKDKTLKCGRPAKQMRAATSATYRDHLLKNCF